jgi:hypothetical protein
VARDRHHIIPRVRCRDLGITPNFPGNIRRVTVSKHRAWHTLFGCLLPEEAIEVIRRDWTLDKEAQREFDKLKGNVEPLRRHK